MSTSSTWNPCHFSLESGPRHYLAGRCRPCQSDRHDREEPTSRRSNAEVTRAGQRWASSEVEFAAIQPRSPRSCEILHTTISFGFILFHPILRVFDTLIADSHRIVGIETSARELRASSCFQSEVTVWFWVQKSMPLVYRMSAEAAHGRRNRRRTHNFPYKLCPPRTLPLFPLQLNMGSGTGIGTLTPI